MQAQAPGPPTTKKRPPSGGLTYFRQISRNLLVFFSFYLVDQRVERTVKRLFKRFGGTFYEKMVSGNMDPDLRDLVLDVVNHIVQLQEYVYCDNPVIKRV